MELRAYWKVLRRRWLVALVPALLVLLVGLVTYQPPTAVYTVGVRFLVSQPPAPATEQSDEERYYTWYASEYVVNGLANWVSGNMFAEAVRAELAAEGISLAPGTVDAGVVVDNARSMLTLSLVHGEPEVLAQMMDAAITVMQEQNAQNLPQLGDTPAVLVPLDQPVINQLPAGLRSQLDLPLRVLLALAAGVALAFFVDYLDPTVRGRDEIEALGLPVLGEIPRK